MVHPSRSGIKTDADKEWKWWKEELAKYKNQLNAEKEYDVYRSKNIQSQTEKGKDTAKDKDTRPLFRLF